MLFHHSLCIKSSFTDLLILLTKITDTSLLLQCQQQVMSECSRIRFDCTGVHVLSTTSPKFFSGRFFCLHTSTESRSPLADLQVPTPPSAFIHQASQSQHSLSNTGYISGQAERSGAETSASCCCSHLNSFFNSVSTRATDANWGSRLLASSEACCGPGYVEYATVLC